MAHPLSILTFLTLATLPLSAAKVAEKPLGRHGRGVRVEVLVGQPPPEPPASPEARKAAARIGSDPTRGRDGDDPPELAWEENGLAYAAQVPWAGPAARAGQWLAAAHRSLVLVSGRGEVRPVPAGRPSRDVPAPDFTRVAVRPGSGGKGGTWEAFAWDARGHRVWRIDAKGRLAPYASLAREIVHCYNLAAGRDGTVYIAGARILPDPDGNPMYATQMEGFYRIGRDRSVTLLAGGRSLGRVEDGTGPEARFAHQITFALAEDRGCAYILDYSDDGARVRTLRLADGAVSSRPLKDPRFRERFVHCWPAYHQGVLLASVTAPPAVFAVDPASGQCEQVYQEPPPHPGQKAADWNPEPVTGPGWREGLQVAKGPYGSMGFNACGLSVGADGQIAFAAGDRLGLLLLDWSDLRSPLSRAW